MVLISGAATPSAHACSPWSSRSSPRFAFLRDVKITELFVMSLLRASRRNRSAHLAPLARLCRVQHSSTANGGRSGQRLVRPLPPAAAGVTRRPRMRWRVLFSEKLARHMVRARAHPDPTATSAGRTRLRATPASCNWLDYDPDASAQRRSLVCGRRNPACARRRRPSWRRQCRASYTPTRALFAGFAPPISIPPSALRAALPKVTARADWRGVYARMVASPRCGRLAWRSALKAIRGAVEDGGSICRR